MNQRHHAIVWIDHREARIFDIDTSSVEPTVVHAQGAGRHLQHKANTTGSGHRGVDKEFFGRVIDALASVDAILITGPANARLELKNFMDAYHPVLAKRISAIEALDHPGDSELVALARKFFQADDRMR